MTELFNFHGCTIAVDSTSSELVHEVGRDFSYFRTTGEAPQVHVRLHLTAPAYDQLPPVSASVITPRNVCFRQEPLTYIDYFGHGLAVYNRQQQSCDIYGMAPDLVHEIAYLFTLSTVGQYLDTQGKHRLHALGVSYRQRGALLLLPSGGGKSTMALRLLREPEFLLLSEDTPLIDRRGWVLPFPLRLGVRPEQETGIPSQYLRTVRRMEFDPKTLIDIEYFHDRLGRAVEPGCLLVGERNLGEVSEILPLSRRRAFKALVSNMVVGLGIYQGMEFLLERGLWEILGKSNVAASRLYNSRP